MHANVQRQSQGDRDRFDKENIMTIGLSVRIVTCSLVFLSSSALVACGRSTSPSPSAPGTAAAVATTSATASRSASHPPGGPAPAKLIGRWSRVVTADGSSAVVTFAANRFRVADRLGGGHGEIVVNGNEIDFFNVQECGLFLPEGVGRYRWILRGTTLHFVPLNKDPCPVRDDHFADQDFTKISS